MYKKWKYNYSKHKNKYNRFVDVKLIIEIKNCSSLLLNLKIFFKLQDNNNIIDIILKVNINSNKQTLHKIVTRIYKHNQLRSISHRLSRFNIVNFQFQPQISGKKHCHFMKC